MVLRCRSTCLDVRPACGTCVVTASFSPAINTWQPRLTVMLPESRRLSWTTHPAPSKSSPDRHPKHPGLCDERESALRAFTLHVVLLYEALRSRGAFSRRVGFFRSVGLGAGGADGGFGGPGDQVLPNRAREQGTGRGSGAVLSQPARTPCRLREILTALHEVPAGGCRCRCRRWGDGRHGGTGRAALQGVVSHGPGLRGQG